MSGEFWVHEDDFSIIQENNFPNRTLFNCDGERLGFIPDRWTEDDVKEMMRFANKAYRYGKQDGRSEKQADIRKALGI